MARVCFLTGKRTSVGNNVSHSVRRTKRTFFPNLFWKNIADPITGVKVRVKLSAKAIKTLKKEGIL
ncbi:MAG: 50S ribosomal protein L28 [Candidatus Gracilibacteria bacterium]|nr:50S ribosomal protein L28 [Candidatus Gracilibacteria bacterium]MDD3119920.1 50S ribosomal protein L28 [Candidatus Gracilibacteria bacterium]MDD4530022.1 50S ribosomal protein L28 [Candidatus Gracilibacteria bacterium]